MRKISGHKERQSKKGRLFRAVCSGPFGGSSIKFKKERLRESSEIAESQAKWVRGLAPYPSCLAAQDTAAYSKASEFPKIPVLSVAPCFSL